MLEIEVREIVVDAKRRKILCQIERTDPVNGDCWRLMLGRGGGYPNAPLKGGDRFIYDDKEKSELAATYFTEVCSNGRETGKGLQRDAEGGWQDRSSP